MPSAMPSNISFTDIYSSQEPTKNFRGKKVEKKAFEPVAAKEGFTFGCDPEGFIFYKDKPVPAAGIIPGTKHEPHPVPGGAIQVDGMAAEFNIDPVSTYEDWENNITGVIEQLKTYLPKGHELRFVPSVNFDKEVFDAAPDHAKDLGCQPDFDAWTGGVNPPPAPANPYSRCAGGHVHLGWTKEEDLSDIQHILNCQDLVKQLDFFLGAWSVNQDPDTIRRSMYGKMGACRYKDYGVEYRTLSNFWVNTPEGRREVWNRMNSAINIMANLFIPDRFPSGYVKLLREYINKSQPCADIEYMCHYPLFTLNSGERRL